MYELTGQCKVHRKSGFAWTQAEAEWAGAGANTGWDVKPERQPPHTEKYDLKPYEPEDDDEYRTDEEKAAKEPHGAKGGAVRRDLNAFSPIAHFHARFCRHC